MRKIRGSVQWINDPQIGRLCFFEATSLFGQDPMGGEMSLDMVYDTLLGSMVRISYQIDRVLILDAETGFRIPKQQGTGFLTSGDRCFEERVIRDWLMR